MSTVASESERGQVEAAGGTPLVSVVIPVFDNEAYIDDAIASARAQTLHDIEIIVIDDGSTDGSRAIADRHAAADQRVRVVSQANQGVARARNTGLRLARAAWVALLDGDDLALPERLERQLAFLADHPAVAVVGTWGWRIGTHSQELGVFDVGPRDEAHFHELRAQDATIYLLASSVVLSKAAALAVGGFRDGLYGAEDVDLWTRLADDHVVTVVPERLTRYRVHASSMSNAVFYRNQVVQLLVAANAARRRTGRPELSLAAFQAELATQPTGIRARQRLVWTSMYCYRMAGGLLADRDPRGAVWLGASMLLWPPVPLGRLRRQMVPWLRARLPGPFAGR